jgi:hypothetical protein
MRRKAGNAMDLKPRRASSALTYKRYCRWARGVYDALELYITPEAGLRLGRGRYSNVLFTHMMANGSVGNDGFVRFEITLADGGWHRNPVFHWSTEHDVSLVARRLIETYAELRTSHEHHTFRAPLNVDDLLRDE